jgi:ubiquinone/menaquinone biosynthesis C-methylase UbiE
MLKLLSRLELPKTLGALAAGPRDTVVELGSGTGRITLPVADRAAEVVAVDFSIASLERARAGRGGRNNIHWVQADISRLPLRPEVADRVLSSQVFEHLPGPKAREGAVDEAARVLKAGGTFVISVYRDSWFWRLLGPKEGYHPGGIYYCRLTNQEFKDLLAPRFAISRMTRNLGLYLQLAACSKKT